MALFTDRRAYGYARGAMPRPKIGDGPWGEAIEYQLRLQKKSQADLSRATKLQPKTVSRIVRGFHTQTRALEKIAGALEVPLADVLISPALRLSNEDRERQAVQITREVLRLMDSRAGGVTKDAVESAAIAERLMQLSGERRKEIVGLINHAEEAEQKSVKSKSRKR